LIDSIGGRKVLAVIIMLVLGVGAVLLKDDVPPNFLNLLQFLFGAFVVGNAVEHASNASIEKAAAKGGGPSVDLAALQGALQELYNQNQNTQAAVVTTNQTLGTILQKMAGSRS
jgi:hypothetical protein